MDKEAQGLISKAVADIQSQFGDLFQSLPIRVTPIAERLGIEVVRSASTSTSTRAQIRIVDLGKRSQQATIYVAKALGQAYARFAVAHEIGHYYLRVHYPDFNQRISARDREVCCHRFAGDLLVPQHKVKFFKDSLFEVREAEDWVRLAGRFGVSVRALFQIGVTHRDEWLRECPIVVLLARHSEHPRPAKDNVHRSGPKLRVRSALFDDQRFYFPTFQGVSSLLAPTDWIFGLQNGDSSTNLVEIRFSLRTRINHWTRTAVGRKYELQQEIVPVSAMRLLPVAGERDSNFVLVIRPG